MWAMKYPQVNPSWGVPGTEAFIAVLGASATFWCRRGRLLLGLGEILIVALVPVWPSIGMHCLLCADPCSALPADGTPGEPMIDKS